MEYYLQNVNAVAEQVGFIGLTDEQLAANEAEAPGPDRGCWQLGELAGYRLRTPD